MTSQYKTYQKYKDSGINWVGEIPEGWKVHKLKRFSRIETGNTPSKEDERYYKDGNFPWIRPDELKEFQPILDSNIKLNKDGKKLARKIPKNSVLVCCIGSLGKIGIAGKELATNQQINSIILNEERCKFQFAKYIIFNSKGEMERIGNANVVSIVNKSQQGEISYCLPPFPQQTTIANFLDSKTARIDTLIKKDKKLIGLLKEKRTALINHAVTKGLPVRGTQTGLDPNANMKDSGIDWIGKIPEGWKIRKIKHLTENFDGKRIPISAEKRENGKIPYYGATGVLDYVKDFIFNEELLLVGEDGAPFFEPFKDVAYIIDGKSWVNNHAHVLRVIGNNVIKWLCYYLNIYDYGAVIKGSTRDKLNQDQLSNMFVVKPSIKEQTTIVNFLDKATTRIDRTIKKIEQKIKLLAEYKKSLIHHTVTGKIDVRGLEY